MATELEAARSQPDAGNLTEGCPLDLPFTGRVPAVMSLVAIPGAVLVNPVFFGLAGGLLAIISLLLSPPRNRLIGLIAFAGSVSATFAGRYFAG